MTDTSNSSVVAVPVKSAWLSKVNWIAAATAVAVALGDMTDILQKALPFVPDKYQHWVTAVIALTGGLATVIARSNFTKTITPAAAAKV